jgi:hypothetical protein
VSCEEKFWIGINEIRKDKGKGEKMTNLLKLLYRTHDTHKLHNKPPKLL